MLPETKTEETQVEDQASYEKRMLNLQMFSQIVKQKRIDAIEGRRASGIEEEWQEDEDHYEGVDHVNSGSSGPGAKPRTINGSFERRRQEKTTSSTVFLKITRPYCDAAAARVSDMLLPTDDRNWALRPTPVPELLNQAKDQSGLMDDMGNPVMMPAKMPQSQPAQGIIRGAINRMFGAQQPHQMRQMTVAEAAQEKIDQAKAAAERAQEEIDDWLVECRYHAEVRKAIESAARIGTGILRGPNPTKKKNKAVMQTPKGWALMLEEKINPASISIIPWNFYPDPNCGENIQDGSYCFERADITARKLRDLKGMEDSGYIDEMIDMCIEEGPVNAVDGTPFLKRNQKLSDKDLFEIWYFHGLVHRKDMENSGCKCEGDKDQYSCVVSMVNDRVIKVAMSPLDSGEFPYDVMIWQERIGHWAGVGVARQMRECQKGANAAVRNLMDNAGLSAGPQIVINRSKIRPADNKWEITPRKIWFTVQDEDVQDVRDAFIIFNIQSLQAELMNILQFWLKEAEDVTGLPMLIQGQQGKAPETVGGMTMLNNNATSVLRRIARTFDDRITEPHIGRYYEWLLLHGPNDAKGDFQIDARGSSALIERDLQNQALMQLVGLSINPAYGLDPEKTIKEVLKSMRFDTKKFEMDEEKKKALAQNRPQDPRIVAAQIMAQSRGQELQMKLGAEAQENALDRQLAQWEKMIDAQLSGADLSSQQRQHLESIKADLSGLAMKLNVQKDLSLSDHVADLHKTYNPPQVINPAAEPTGRAQPGRAFSQ